MKNMRALRAAWLMAASILLMLVLALPVSARDEWEKEGYAQVTTSAVLRSRYSNLTAVSAIKVVPKGSVIHVTGYAGKNWYKVSYGSKSGYLFGLYLTGEDDEDLSDNAVKRTLAADVVFRSSPKVLTTNIINILKKDAELTILGERADNWIHVSYDGDDGYIRAGFFSDDPKTGAGYAWRYASQQLFVRSTTAVTKNNVVATIKKGKRVKVTGVTFDNWYKVLYKGKTCYVKEGYFTTEAKQDYVTETIANAIYFRSSRSTEKDNVIRVLNPGTVIRVYKSMTKRWYKIKAGSTSGYILGGYFTSDHEAAESTSTKRVTTAALRMRTGRGTDYSVITVIPKGATVTLTARSGEWYQVKYATSAGTYTGWVAGSYLAEAD